MLRSTRRSLRTALAMLTLGVAAAACSDDDPTGPGQHAEPVRAEVFLRGSAEVLADTHDDHWHGSVSIADAAGVELDVRFYDEDDRVVPLGGDHAVQATIATGQPAGVVTVESHGDHLELTPVAAGETRIVIHFTHDGDIEWSTPALRVTVVGG